MSNQKNYLLIVAIILLLFGIFKPSFFSTAKPVSSNIKVVQPDDNEMQQCCEELSNILQTGKSTDALRLASLYSDISDLIALDGEGTVITNTEEIRQANKLSGTLLNLNIQGKYKGLAEAANAVVVKGIGDDNIVLDKDLRTEAVKTFRILAWACKEGSK